MKEDEILMSIINFLDDIVQHQAKEIDELKSKNEGIARLCSEAIELAKKQNARTKVNMN